MNWILVFLIILGLFLLTSLHCKIFRMLQNSDILWWTTLTIITVVPILIVSITSINDDIVEKTILYCIWYLIPIGILLIIYLHSNAYEATSNSLNLTYLGSLIISIVILGLGLDLRITKPLYSAFGEAYAINALHVSFILVLFIPKLDLMFSECPYTFNKDTIADAMIQLVIVALIIIPIGLITQFITFKPLLNFETIPVSLLVFLGIYATIGLPEELLMRAYFLNTLDNYLKDKYGENTVIQGITLIAVAALFGLTHWNNTSPAQVPWYILLATIAGIVYGIAWRKGKLHEAVLIHTLVDWIWNYFFI